MEVIKVENLSKQYLLHHQEHSLLKSPLFWKKEKLWALKGIDFSVSRGEVCCLLGDNGSGKTTLLKAISGLIKPTSGKIQVEGKITPLIDLWSGLYPDLSGRENIYLNGLILGMTKREIKQKMEKIIKFSELKRFIDSPLRAFSDGMTLRLIFSLAIHSSPDIFIIDEVLAVGDAAFREKCISALRQNVALGKTLLFVNHNLKVIETMNPSKIIWLSKGRVKKIGDLKLIEEYKKVSTQLFDSRLAK